MSDTRFLDGIHLFNDRKYFECHDLFEEIWMTQSGKNAEFYRALIHIAVGCYHMNNKNYRGAKSQLIKGVQKLEPYKPAYQGVVISPLIDSFHTIILDVERVVQGKLNHDQIHPVPKIDYND